MNRTLEDVLAKLVQDVPEEWDKWLPIVCFAYNTSVHRVTKETPMRMIMGREARTPLTMLVPPPPDEPREQSSWLHELMEQFRNLHANVAVLKQQTHQAEALWRYRRQRGFHFEPGAQVWLWVARTRSGRSPQRWTGPWTVDARFSDVVYKISREGQSPQVINVDRIRPYLQLDPIRFPSDETDSGDSSESSESDDENERTKKNNRTWLTRQTTKGTGSATMRNCTKARAIEDNCLITTKSSAERLLPPVHNAQDMRRGGSKVTTRAPSKE
jgi:hypothetical protein